MCGIAAGGTMKLKSLMIKEMSLNKKETVVAYWIREIYKGKSGTV